MKKKVLLLSLILAGIMNFNTAFAADIIYYDDSDLDAFLEEFQASTSDEKEQAPTLNEEEPTREDIYYKNPDGTLAKGLTDTGEVRRYFDKKTGQMVKNMTIASENIHVDKSGKAHYIGWDYFNGKLGYYDPQTGYAKGLKTIGNITYGFDENGAIFRKQNRVFNGQNYYFNKFGEATKTDGKYARGWVGDRYFFEDGKPAEGLVEISGKKYAFHEISLRLLRNTEKVFNHKLYKINDKGEAIYQYDVAHANLSRGTNGEFKPGFSQNLMRKTPYFYQKDGRWAKRTYATGTMGGFGCGPTAMAMVLNRKLNTNDIYPTNTMAVARDYSSWDGTDWQYFIEGVEAYGLKSYDIPIQKDAFIQALKNNPIVVRVGAGSFINTGHYMVVDSYQKDHFLINDPYNMRRNTLDNIPWQRLRGEVTVAWEIK
ncbi:C39 family peptidase [uncultured Anaerococcus sp.]|uniref:C39 family peptidase n=1 Tax=uncultured Anaerococcus sp. TaxID=293428 RepID=UPI00288AE148|nr:C39 family peptidase [uncultured Anaerococcus sp.]